MLKEKIKTYDYKIAFFHILLKHYLEYIDNGNKLEVPKRIKEETETYFCDNNPVQKFLDSSIIITNNNNDRIKSSILYNMYREYCENDTKGITTVRFNQILTEKNIQHKRTNAGVCFMGIKQIVVEQQDFID